MKDRVRRRLALAKLIEAIQDESSAGPFDPTVLRPTENAHLLA